MTTVARDELLLLRRIRRLTSALRTGCCDTDRERIEGDLVAALVEYHNTYEKPWRPSNGHAGGHSSGVK